MEWLPGRTLSEEVAFRGAFEPAEAVRVICDLCAALAVTHEVGVVHRDLKGSNVVAVPTDEWFRMTLVDFGIAKLLDPDLGEAATTVGVRVGSPHAMAPEQVLGTPVDARTDIYALGILAYQLLTSQLPFDAATPEELEDMHLSAAPVRPSRICSLPRELETIVLACLSKSRDGRPATVRSLAAALRAAV
jgi:serine/threonine-protein kinase